MSDEIPKPDMVAKPFSEPPRTKTSPEMKAAKKNSNKWKAIGAVITALATGASGRAYLKSASAEENSHDEVTTLKVEQSTLRKDHEDFKKDTKDEFKDIKDSQVKTNRKVDKIDAKLDLLLDERKVPKSKRPKDEEE